MCKREEQEKPSSFNKMAKRRALKDWGTVQASKLGHSRQSPQWRDLGDTHTGEGGHGDGRSCWDLLRDQGQEGMMCTSYALLALSRFHFIPNPE